VDAVLFEGKQNSKAIPINGKRIPVKGIQE
jgi:hypothetical protein